MSPLISKTGEWLHSGLGRARWRHWPAQARCGALSWAGSQWQRLHCLLCGLPSHPQAAGLRGVQGLEGGPGVRPCTSHLTRPLRAGSAPGVGSCPAPTRAAGKVPGPWPAWCGYRGVQQGQPDTGCAEPLARPAPPAAARTGRRGTQALCCPCSRNSSPQLGSPNLAAPSLARAPPVQLSALRLRACRTCSC